MCSSSPSEAVAVGPKASRSPSSPSEAVTVGHKALNWDMSPLHHRVTTVRILEPDWDSFLLPEVISVLEWDSFLVPVMISELD